MDLFTSRYLGNILVNAYNDQALNITDRLKVRWQYIHIQGIYTLSYVPGIRKWRLKILLPQQSHRIIIQISSA